MAIISSGISARRIRPAAGSKTPKDFGVGPGKSETCRASGGQAARSSKRATIAPEERHIYRSTAGKVQQLRRSGISYAAAKRRVGVFTYKDAAPNGAKSGPL